MAIKTDGWKAEIDGQLFPTEKAATEHDMKLIGERIAPPGQGLVVYANIINIDPDETIRLLLAYVKAHPRAKAIVPAEKPKLTLCGDSTPYDNVARVVGEIQAAGEAGKSFLRRLGFSGVTAFSENCAPSDLEAWAAAKESIAEHTPSREELERKN